jgi:hypothetical protein
MRLECIVLYSESQVVVISSFGAYASGEKRLRQLANVPLSPTETRQNGEFQIQYVSERLENREAASPV